MSETKIYYRGNPLGLTWGERWRICPNILVFAIYALLCIFRFRFGGEFALAYPCQILGVNEEELSKEAKEEIAKSDKDWAALGFQRDRIYTLELLGREELIGLCYRHPSEPTILASVIYYRMLFNNVETIRVINSLSSTTESGTVYSTLDSKRELLGPPQFLRHFMKGEPLSALLVKHKERIGEVSEPLITMTPESIGRLLQEWNNTETEFQAARSFYVQADDTLVEKLTAESNQAACTRCGDFLGESFSIDHPGYCKACQPIRAEEEKKERLKARAGAHTLLGLLAGFLGALFFIWRSKASGLFNTVHLIIALIFGLVVFLVILVLGRLFDKIFKQDQKRKVRM